MSLAGKEDEGAQNPTVSPVLLNMPSPLVNIHEDMQPQQEARKSSVPESQSQQSLEKISQQNKDLRQTDTSFQQEAVFARMDHHNNSQQKHYASNASIQQKEAALYRPDLLDKKSVVSSINPQDRKQISMTGQSGVTNLGDAKLDKQQRGAVLTNELADKSVAVNEEQKITNAKLTLDTPQTDLSRISQEQPFLYPGEFTLSENAIPTVGKDPVSSIAQGLSVLLNISVL